MQSGELARCRNCNHVVSIVERLSCISYINLAVCNSENFVTSRAGHRDHGREAQEHSPDNHEDQGKNGLTSAVATRV
jgi:hypothetical protein